MEAQFTTQSPTDWQWDCLSFACKQSCSVHSYTGIFADTCRMKRGWFKTFMDIAQLPNCHSKLYWLIQQCMKVPQNHYFQKLSWEFFHQLSQNCKDSSMSRFFLNSIWIYECCSLLTYMNRDNTMTTKFTSQRLRMVTFVGSPWQTGKGTENCKRQCHCHHHPEEVVLLSGSLAHRLVSAHSCYENEKTK